METNKAPKPELTERASEIIGLYQKALNVVDKEEKEKALNEFGLSLVKLLVPKFEPKFEIEEKSAVDTMINGLGAATLYFGLLETEFFSEDGTWTPMIIVGMERSDGCFIPVQMEKLVISQSNIKDGSTISDPNMLI
jgi:hypothetical protein